MYRRKKKSSRVAISFLATIAVLVGLVVSSYFWGGFGPGVPVRTIPNPLPAYGGVIGRFAPVGALQVSYDNLTAVRAINSTALGVQVFMNLAEPPLVLDTGEINVRITVALTNPNATVSAIYLTPGAFQAASNAFNHSSISPSDYGGFKVYSVADHAGVNATSDWVTLLSRDGVLLYSQGALPGLSAVEASINVYTGGASSVLTRTDVQRMLYAVNGTSGHLAIGIQNFVGAVQTGLGTLVAVDNTGTSLRVTYVVKFSDSATAQAQVKTVKADYLGAHSFAVYDELVSAMEFQALSSLRAAVGLVG